MTRMTKTATKTYADGYIERREVDGRTLYFWQIDSPGFSYGPLCETADLAKAQGRAECERRGLHVPCFYA